MKKTLFMKIAAAALVCVMIAVSLASCGGKALMTLEYNGKTYTANAQDVKYNMVYQKLQLFLDYGMTSSSDTVTALWGQSSGDAEGSTYDKYFTDYAMEQLKFKLVIEALLEEYGLENSEKAVADAKTECDSFIKGLGGKGAFKQYFGYTADKFREYRVLSDTYNLELDYLYGDEGKEKLSAEYIKNLFNDNFVGYRVICLDMQNKIVLDDNGNRVVKTSTATDGTVTELDEFSKKQLNTEEIEEKAGLPELIQNKIKEGTSFEELVKTYTENFYAAKYTQGFFVTKSDSELSLNTGSDSTAAKALLSDATIAAAIKDLEIGDVSATITTGNGEYTYIIQRIALVDDIYDSEANPEYAEYFGDFDSIASNNAFYKKINAIMETITCDTEALAKYTMSDTFLSYYADAYASSQSSGS